MLNDGIIVRHVNKGYKGRIDGKTRLKDCFTGNQACDFQYRVVLPNRSIEIAPEEDLEILTNTAEHPIFPGQPKGYRDSTELRDLGYQIMGLTTQERRDILFGIAIPQLGVAKVFETLLMLINSRMIDSDMASCYRNALVEWDSDIDELIKEFGDELKRKHVRLTDKYENIKSQLKFWRIL